MNTYKLQNTTIWNFPDRETGLLIKVIIEEIGHHMFLSLILKYTEQKDLVLDLSFVGSGTTLIEAKLLDRKCYRN